MLFFCSTYDIFLVCSTNFLVCRKKKFEHTVQTFAVSLSPFGVSFCHLMGRVLSPYGVSSAARVLLPFVKIFDAQYKSLLHFSRVCVCKSHSMLSKIKAMHASFTPELSWGRFHQHAGCCSIRFFFLDCQSNPNPSQKFD